MSLISVKGHNRSYNVNGETVYQWIRKHKRKVNLKKKIRRRSR